MTVDLETARRESEELIEKLQPLFENAHSFVILMALSDLIARWLHMHDMKEHPRLANALMETTIDRLNQLEVLVKEGTKH